MVLFIIRPSGFAIHSKWAESRLPCDTCFVCVYLCPVCVCVYVYVYYIIVELMVVEMYCSLLCVLVPHKS